MQYAQDKIDDVKRVRIQMISDLTASPMNIKIPDPLPVEKKKRYVKKKK